MSATQYEAGVNLAGYGVFVKSGDMLRSMTAAEAMAAANTLNAGPDLLEFLRTVWKWNLADREIGRPTREQLDERDRRIRQMIAKAEGLTT